MCSVDYIFSIHFWVQDKDSLISEYSSMLNAVWYTDQQSDDYTYKKSKHKTNI